MRPVSYELEKKNYTTLKPGGKGMKKKKDKWMVFQLGWKLTGPIGFAWCVQMMLVVRYPLQRSCTETEVNSSVCCEFPAAQGWAEEKTAAQTDGGWILKHNHACDTRERKNNLINKHIYTIFIPYLGRGSSRYAVNRLALANTKHVVLMGIEPRTFCF